MSIKKYIKLVKAAFVVGCPILQVNNTIHPKAIVAHWLVFCAETHRNIFDWYEQNKAGMSYDPSAMKEIDKVIKLLWYDGLPDLKGNSL